MSEEFNNIVVAFVLTICFFYYKHTKDEYDKKNEILEKRKFDKLLNDFALKNKDDNIISTFTIPDVDFDFKKAIIEILTKNNFPKEFKEKIQLLIQTTSNHNLILCTKNIKTIKLQKMQNNIIMKVIQKEKMDGTYNAKKNEIVYYNNDALGHEILHMASSFNHENKSFSGFEIINQYNYVLFKGLNEGYTELLNRRKFHNDNYQTNCYKTNLFVLRMLELLFKDKELLETAYFQNNADFVYNTFRQYGSKQEFFKITKYLDFFCNAIIDSEDKELLEFVKDIIIRTNNTEKIKMANDIYDEYFDTTKKKRKRLYQSFG